MKLVDPDLELVAVGSSNQQMPTFGTWEHTVLTHVYDEVDYISMHAYYQEHDGDAASFLAEAIDMDAFIDGVVATADAVKAAGKHDKQIDISFDEWNVWYQRGLDTEDQPHQVSKRWEEAPRLIEDSYTVTDAVVVGTLLHSLLRHGDRVRIANQAQLVNVIAPIRAEAGGLAWRQTTFWPFARMAEMARGEIMQLSLTSDQTPTAKFGDVEAVDAVATWDREAGRLALFAANRSLEVSAEVEVSLRGLNADSLVRAEVLTVPEGGDRHSVNVEKDPDAVGLVPLEEISVGDGVLRFTLPALAWAAIQVKVSEA